MWNTHKKIETLFLLALTGCIMIVSHCQIIFAWTVAEHGDKAVICMKAKEIVIENQTSRTLVSPVKVKINLLKKSVITRAVVVNPEGIPDESYEING